MSRFQVILVNGISATGKTTVGRWVADALRIPLFAKDAVKELLFDTVGIKDREWSHQLSGASHTILNYVMEEELKAGRGFVIEANFIESIDVPKFQKWQTQYGFEIVQILCFAEGQVVFDRFKQRVDSGARHPGHMDHVNVEPYRGYLMAGKCSPLAIEGKVIEVDTTDFAKVDVNAILEQIRAS